MSEVMEDLFDDGLAASGTSGGLNRTGTYSVKIKLRRDVPQILPIMEGESECTTKAFRNSAQTALVLILNMPAIQARLTGEATLKNSWNQMATYPLISLEIG